jgi:RNA polymerase sigma-70 factor, ECF subfamily
LTQSRPHGPWFEFETELISLIPQLRAFARTFQGHPFDADDLVQDAVAKAWQARASYSGTNMRAWTFMILRNVLISQKRRSWRSSHLDPQVAEETLVSADDPEAQLTLNDVRQALAMLPDVQREALIMIGAGDFSYEEAAEITQVPVGTVKSRVSRARSALAEILEQGAFDRDGKSASSAMSDIISMARKTG